MKDAGKARKWRFEPGDKAIVSRCKNRSRVGLVVAVIGPHEGGDFDWDVEILGMPVKGRAIHSGRVGKYRRAAVFDWNLTPLRGLGHSSQEAHRAADREKLQTS